MIALLVGALFLPALGVFLIIPVLAAMMMYEFYGMMDQAGLRNYRHVGAIGGLVLILATAGNYLVYGGVSVYQWEGLVLAGIVMAVLLRQLFEKDDAQPLVTLSVTWLGVLYIAFIFNFYTKLLLQWPEGDGRLVLFYMILIVKVTDMAAYFTGCSIGRHKLIPRVSPAKTWEGCAGGVAGGMATSLLFWWLTGGTIGPLHLNVADALVLGILLSVTGIVGDLIESMFKRAAAVKDSGGLLKGMGGVLDVLDSLLFAAPVLYVYIILCLAP